MDRPLLEKEKHIMKQFQFILNWHFGEKEIFISPPLPPESLGASLSQESF